jgi:hypothetical protein
MGHGKDLPAETPHGVNTMKKASQVACMLLLATVVAFAQKGPCTEELIRAELTKLRADSTSAPQKTEDYYLFNPLLEKPVVGAEERNQANKALEPLKAKRKNTKGEYKVDRIVAAPSGDMAYDYGTTHFSYDDSDTGKHVDVTVASLHVWRADGASCKMAASMLQGEGQR